MADEAALFEVEGLRKYFNLRTRGRGRREVRAVDGVSFSLATSESLGLVGESGSGKSTLARMLVGLEVPSSGEVRFRGKNVLSLPKRERHEMRRRVQLIAQNPRASLDPRLTIGKIIAEGWTAHPIVPRSKRAERVKELLQQVGLPATFAERYPAQLSGGQQQRVSIARALAVEPEVLICDEPVSALDVSVQAQVVNLLEDLRADRHLSYVFISHDLSVVQHITDSVAVMYLGQLVEVASTEDLFMAATHPYTQALLSAVLGADLTGARRERIILKGEISDAPRVGAGCSFRGRCWKAQDFCSANKPDLLAGEAAGHPCACFFAEALHAAPA